MFSSHDSLKSRLPNETAQGVLTCPAPAIAGNPAGGAPILIAPGIDVQLGMEGIVASVVVMIGTIGLGLMYYASKYVFQPGYATRLLILGMILAGVAFLVFSYMFALKTTS